MYSLVALGFVLIYKASGVFNFAQGTMVFFAALTYVSLVERGWNLWLALVVTLAGDGGARVAIRARGAAAARQPAADHALHGDHRLTVRARGPVAADLGLAAARPRARHPDVPMEWLSQKWNINISQFDLFAAFVAGLLVAVLAVFFQKTRIGRALRAVADDHQAALAVGIRCSTSGRSSGRWPGFVALVAGLMWGVRNGVQFALTFVALKALPVLLIGGFESIPGAILGGLIIGATEKLAEVYVGPMFGGGIESWFAYVVALLFLLGAARGAVRREAHRRV
jgi:branched-chain amino acid transport system permease protein